MKILYWSTVGVHLVEYGAKTLEISYVEFPYFYCAGDHMDLLDKTPCVIRPEKRV